jgi:hypothetical protein
MVSAQRWRPPSVPSAVERFKDVARLSTYDPTLERLAQDFEDIVIISGPLVSIEDPIVHSGDLFRLWYLAAANQSNV